MPDVHIKIDTAEFQRAFRKYLEVSRRGITEDVNQKAYSVMISAVALTKAATKAEVRKQLMAESDYYGPAPLAAILVNWKAGTGGGLYGDDMREAVKELVRTRADAVNFLRAGWLSAVAIFAKAIRKPVGKFAVKFLARYGFGTYGGAEAAIPSWNPTATFYNMAFSRYTSTDNGRRYAIEGLEKALAQEVRRMGEYVARKMQERSNKLAQAFFGI